MRWLYVVVCIVPAFCKAFTGTLGSYVSQSYKDHWPRFRLLHNKTAAEWLKHLDSSEVAAFERTASIMHGCRIVSAEHLVGAVHPHVNNVLLFYLVEIDETACTLTLWDWTSNCRHCTSTEGADEESLYLAEIVAYQSLQERVSQYRGPHNEKGVFVDARYLAQL